MTTSSPPRTVLFTDMEGSTAFNRAQGDEVAIALMRVHEMAVREAAKEYDGWVVKSTGDGYLVVFAASDEGVSCALDIHARLREHNARHPQGPLRVRMGLHTGSVIQDIDDVFGLTVTTASRIASKATSGQLLVSDAVRLDAPDGDWMFVDRGLFWLKGLLEQWRLYEATRDGHGVAGVRETGLPLVGRDHERALLRRHVERAAAGHGGLVLVTGSAGTGKTRLVEEVGIEAEAGECQFLIGRCHDTSQTDAYTPLVEILETVERRLDPDEFRLVVGDSAPEVARLLPHLGSRDPDATSRTERPAVEQRRYLFMSVRDVIARLAAPRPIVVLLDDLHWADAPSLMFLEHLAAELASLPILVVGTYRSEALSATVPLHRTLARLHQRHLVETIEVGPLQPEDIADLLQGVGGAPPPNSLVRALHDTTQGNAFFLGEVVQQLVERDVLFDESGWRPDLDRLDFDVPESVRLTIESRLQGLQDDTQRMLTAVCLIGREFGFDLLHAVCELSEDDLVDALDEAERARMLVSRADAGSIRFTFAHELVRQTLLSQISHTRRQRLHIRVADALEQVNAATLPEHAAAIAYHLLEAGPFADRDRTVRWLTRAGERALETAAFEEAVRHFRLVLATVDDEPAVRAPLLERVATAERSLGHLDEALSLWGDAIDAYEAIPDPASAARVCLDAAIQVAWWRRGGDVSRLVGRGLDLLGSGEESTRAGLLAVAGMSSSEQGPYERGEELLSEASALATAGGDLQVLGLTLYARAAHHFAYQEFRETVEVGVESMEYLRRVGDLWNLANVLGYVGSSLGWLGRFDEAADIGAEGEALAHRLGNWSAFVFSEQARGFSDIGSRPEASTLEDRGRQALDLGRDMGFPWLSSVGHARVGLAAFWRGEWREAVDRFDELARFEGTGAAGGSMGRLLLLVHAYLGDRAATAELIERARPGFPTSARPAPARVWTLAATAVEALRMLGEEAAAGELYDTMCALAEATGGVMRTWDFRLVSTLQGIASGCNGDWDVAEAHFEESLLLARSLPMLRELPEARRFYAQMLVDRGRPSDRKAANELLRGAIDEYTSFGMPRHAQLARDMAH